ncbi:hypothetical protein ACQR09_25040 [Bradyrhizobium oligotrophicum]|uniref:hypothetical protein n=1 Tax=Bradyrhizobium oligotrophicum TaxID=44255 RepID=UPI003EBB51E0
MFRRVIALLVLALPCSPASASSRSVMNDFGLAGTWSLDCSKDAEKQSGGYRMTVNAPIFGTATSYSVMRLQDGKLLITKNEIEGALRLTESKIQLTINPIERSIGGQLQPREGVFSSKLLVTYEKVGQKIHVFDAHSPDGKYVTAEDGHFANGVASPMLERCFD